jgi:type II secretory pathway component GspD/PulD (secretin)
MKKLILSLAVLGVAGLLVSAVAQDAPGDNNPPPPPPDLGGGAPGGDDAGPPPAPPELNGDQQVVPPAEAAAPETNNATAENPIVTETTTDNTATNSAPEGTGVILPGRSKIGSAEDVEAKFMPPASGTNANELRLNFRNAPLEMVLNYLSDAAGFIIVLDTRVNGNITVISSHPMTKDEAVDLLNSALNKNGYAAIRNGRTLTIVDKNDAKTREIPVKTGNDPEEIPKNAEIVTQIIPIRFVEARQLVSDLTSFVSPQATVVANEAGNSIVITDTQQNIRHLTEIIKAIDGSAQTETEIRVFPLKHANPVDVATELTSVFPSSSSSSGNTQSPIRFGGGGGPGGFFSRMMGGGGGGNNNNNSSSDRIKKATSVNAVADSRIQAVIVTAPKDLMEQIAGMMAELDVTSTRDQKVFVYHMDNGDPQQAVQVLQTMFQTSGTSRSGSSSSQNSALMQRAQNNATTTTSSSSSSTGFGTSGGGGGRGGVQF